MPDYKEMYLIMVRASEIAAQVLIEAQQRCEELYINAENEKSPVPSPAGEAGGSKGAG